MSNVPSIIVPSQIQQPAAAPGYPISGVGIFTGNLPLVDVIATLPASSLVGNDNSLSPTDTDAFLRVNSFSTTTLPNNTIAVAIAAQNDDVTSVQLIPFTDSFAEIELDRRQSSRVRVAVFPFDNTSTQATTVRNAYVLAVDDVLQTVTIEVDAAIFGLPQYQILWCLIGLPVGTRFQVESRISPNRFVCKFYNTPFNDLIVGTSFTYVSYITGDSTYGFATTLPYIEYNGLAIPSVNPQIATNANIFPSPNDIYVYIVCQAPVNGTYQLFFCGLRLNESIGENDEIYLWKQLTFNGENKNPRIQVDNIGNLHIVWESNRCGNKNSFGVYYGVLGTSSRSLINEAFISALDKQSMAIQNLSSSFSSIVAISEPVALDLRPENEYGSHYGSAWTSYGTGVTIADAGTITISGNASIGESVAFASLSSDQSYAPFDGKFSQLSYQIAFSFTMNPGSSPLSEDTIKSNYAAFKSGFTAIKTSANDVNVYTKSGKQYTISRYTKFDGGLIPVVGAYELNGSPPSAGAKLKHFMLAAVPEKVSFIATNIANASDTVTQTYYTGKYKLSLLLSTSANLSNQTELMQAFHAVRDFGTLYVGTQYNFMIAVHYAHLHTEDIAAIEEFDAVNVSAQNVTFTGNVIVSVQSVGTSATVTQIAENFVPAFNDTYYSFDIGIGIIPGGQFPINVPTAYNQNIFENQSVTMAFSSIAVGPHTIIADPFLTAMSKFDRNVSRMVIKNTVSESISRTAFDESFLTDDQYSLSFGLYDNKITLSQVPVTFQGKNTCPSIAVDDCNKIHIAYQSNRDNSWQIYYAGTVDPSIPFRFDTRITNTQSNATNPTVAVDQNGRRLVAWHDDRNGPFQIYAARSNRNITCNAAKLASFIPVTGEPSNEYDPYDPYATDICGVIFTFTNQSSNSQIYQFSLAFYADEEMTKQAAYINSSFDTTNWMVNGQQMSSTGTTILPGQSVTVSYYPKMSDNLINQLYYVHINGIDNSTSTPWPYIYIYYCQIQQSPTCTIPCMYTNSTASPKSVHFKVSFYSDIALTKLVLSADSSLDQRNWISGPSIFPSVGVSVPAYDTASVYYIPNVLPPELYFQQNQATATSLLCGANYYITVQTVISSVYSSPIETFAYECPCSGINPQIWRNDIDSQTWICSGQGFNDVRITNTQSNALFPSAVGSSDGIVYIAWEDYREIDTSTNPKTLSPGIFFAVWDANADAFYSSAQGSYDQRIAPYFNNTRIRCYKPTALIGNFQNPAFLFNTQNNVFCSNYSLFREPAGPSIEADYPVGSGVFAASTFSTITNSDIINCLNMQVVNDDVVDNYFADGSTPIQLVKSCIVRLDVIGPAGTYAIRLRNENETKWSDWLSILPELPDYPPRNQYNLRGDGTMRDVFEAFFIRDNEFIVPWVLSAGSGNKTVYAEILTQSGKTPQITLNIIARYDDLQYKIEFFALPDFSVPMPMFNGMPVISTEMLAGNIVQGSGSSSSSSSSKKVTNVVNNVDVSTITQTLQTIDTIYIKVTFTNIAELQKILNLASVQKFSTIFSPGVSPNLSFNVLQQGVNAQYGLPLTLVNSSVPGIYAGSFSVTQSDGVYNKDGLACVVVNVPNPATKTFVPDFTFEQMDMYNVNLPSLGDFTGPYSIVPQETPNDIKTRQRTDVSARTITLQEFKYKYNKNISCMFTSQACVSGSPLIDSYDDEITSPPEFTGPLICSQFNWTAYDAKEPSYYLDGSNLPVWVEYSPPFYIDMSDPRTLSLGFGSTSENTGILFLIPEGAIITVTGTGAVAFTISNNSILIDNTSGYLCGDSTPFRNATTSKTFTMNTSTATLPVGSVGNNGTTITSDIFTTGWYVRTFTEGIPKSILASYGYINNNGVFRGKFAFIRSGTGYCYIRGCTCSANCV